MNNKSILTHKRLTGIYIGVLIHEDLVKEINKKSIKVKATRTGIGNLYGNKGYDIYCILHCVIDILYIIII